MNILKKIYCRTFQTVFHIAIPFLPYKNPEILNSVTDICDLLKQKNYSNPIIITDETIYSLGLTTVLENSLRDNHINYTLFKEILPNPTTDMVQKAVSVYMQNNCDCIIAFGGGSPMDCAKAAGALIARPNKSLAQLSGILRVIKKLPLLIAVPTTAGTGSETTLAAVITDSQTRHKYTINDFPLIPKYAVLDADITQSLPKMIAATTGMDALCHAVEAFIGRSTTKDTLKDALLAVKLIFENIEKAVFNNDFEARKNMLLASHYAGRAFSKSYVGYIHAVSHSLSGEYNLAHGLTNAQIMPIVLEMYQAAVYKKLSALAACIGINKGSDKENSEEFICRINQLNNKFGIPEKISEIQEKDIKKLAAYADKEANPLYPVPVLWDKTELEKIYYKIRR